MKDFILFAAILGLIVSITVGCSSRRNSGENSLYLIQKHHGG